MDGGSAPDGDRTTPPEQNTDCRDLNFFSQKRETGKSYFCVKKEKQICILIIEKEN